MSSNDAVGGTPVEGAVALVTGGRRGFGKAVVDELLARGAAKVYATSRSADLAAPADPRIVPLVLDVAGDASVAAAAEQAGDISILVNNAGESRRAPVLTAPLDDIRAEFETNAFGILRTARAFAPLLAKHDRSTMLNVLSVLSWLAMGRGYEASKAAAWSITDSLRAALRDQGTTVIGLHVAFMDTDMTAGLEVPKADPRDIARLAVDAIVTGTPEVLADETTRRVKAKLSEPVTR